MTALPMSDFHRELAAILTAEALADRLDKIRTEPRFFAPAEREAFLYEAAQRLASGEVRPRRAREGAAG